MPNQYSLGLHANHIKIDPGAARHQIPWSDNPICMIVVLEAHGGIVFAHTRHHRLRSINLLRLLRKPVCLRLGCGDDCGIFSDGRKQLPPCCAMPVQERSSPSPVTLPPRKGRGCFAAHSHCRKARCISFSKFR